MKIIVAGSGTIGSAISARLAVEDCELTVIDTERKILRSSEQLDVRTVAGNAASMPVLRAAGVENADLLIAVTNADETNILCCLTARNMNPNLKTVARLRNPDYSEQISVMRSALGMTMSINPEKDAAIEIMRLLQYPSFIKRDSFSRGRIEIVELKVAPDNKLCGVYLRDLKTVCGVQVLVCAVLRDEHVLVPAGSDVLREGDRIFVTAASENLHKLIGNLQLNNKRVKHAMIIGGGRFGIGLAEQLLQNKISVKIIEKDYGICERIAQQLPNVSVVNGDGCNQQLLESEGIETTDALVALTSSDEQNLIISMYANKVGLQKIITRVDKIENYSLFNDMGVGSIISPKELCGSQVVRFVRAFSNKTGSMLSLHRIADGKAEAMEFVINEGVKNIDVPLKDIKLKRNVLVACITTGQKVTIANGLSRYQLGDRVVIVVTGQNNIKNINDIFE